MTFLLACNLLQAQNTTAKTDFQEFRFAHKKINRTGMWLLGSWAVGNVLVSGAVLALGRAKGEERYFHQMNILWNAVNLSLAGLGLYQNYQTDVNITWHSTLSESYKMQKMLLFNAGLDVGYIVAGFFLKEKAKNTQNLPERLQGWGKSLILQGAFLFVFDVVFTVTHSRNSSKMLEKLEKLQLSTTENGVGLIYRIR